MEKRSRRRIRDLVALAASQGLSQNEIGCARISMMARSTNAPCKGRIQMRKTNPLHFFTFGLQRTAGPYIRVKRRHRWAIGRSLLYPNERTSSDRSGMSVWCHKRKSGPLHMSRAMDHQLWDKRKPDPERRAAMIAVFRRYYSLVRIDNSARDRQPHAHAFRLAGEKRFEDLF